MGETSKIEWTDHTFNPWWGCEKVSQACKSCYAEAWARRTGHDIWGADKSRRFFGDKHWQDPLKWNREARATGVRRRVFCASMADVFEDRRDLDVWRSKLWGLIIDTPGLDWMLLTKRPENCGRLFPRDWWIKGLPDNIWLGCTFDDKGPERADILRGCTARVKFLSVEPLIAPVTLVPWLDRLDLVIVGAESGAKARPMREEWVRQIRDECRDAGVAFFYKQKLDGRGHKVSLPLLDGEHWAQMPESPHA